MSAVRAQSAPNKIEDVDAEGKSMTREEIVEEVKKGKMTWEEFNLFIKHENHRPFACLFALTILTFIGVFVFVIRRFWTAFMADQHSADSNGLNDALLGRSFRHILGSFAVSVGGLTASTYLAYVSELLKEQINRMRANNQKLKEHIEKLKNAVGDLSNSAKDMAVQIKQFEGLNKQLVTQGDAQNADFGQIMETTGKVFSRMKETHKAQVGLLFKKIAQDCEMLDDEDGLTAEEYEVLKKHIDFPIPLPTFAEVTQNKTASFEEVDRAIDEMVARY